MGNVHKGLYTTWDAIRWAGCCGFELVRYCSSTTHRVDTRLLIDMPLFKSFSSKKSKKSADTAKSNEFKAVSYASTAKGQDPKNGGSSKSKIEFTSEVKKGEMKDGRKLTPYEQWIASQRRNMERWFALFSLSLHRQVKGLLECHGSLSDSRFSQVVLICCIDEMSTVALTCQLLLQPRRSMHPYWASSGSSRGHDALLDDLH